MYKNIQFKAKNHFFSIVLLIFCFYSSEALYARAEDNHKLIALTQQNIKTKKVTINLKDKQINVILAEIQKQTRIEYGFNSSLKPENMGLFSIAVQEISVEEALNILLMNTKYKYSIVANKIIIEPKPAIEQNKRITVKGKVLSEEKQPLIGAMVLLKGSTNGAITDNNGEYVITFVPQENTVLSFSFVGYLDKDVPYSGGSTLNVEMRTDAMAVDDVVVTGIFNKPRESYVGAVTTVTAKDLKMFKGQNLLQTLKNIDPAFNVVVDNDFGSDPNRLPEINIRGNSSLPMTVNELNENAQAQLNAPLVIMDGFEISLKKLMDFNDEEIESINIMKDAAATAIYGSRGANGVVVVTTKAPVEGKLKLFVQGGLNIEIPDLTSYDLLNGREKLDLEVKAGLYDLDISSPGFDSKERYSNILKDVLAGVNTDWKSQPIQTGVGQQYNARIEGGSSEFRWGASLGYKDVNGVMKGSDKKTFSGSVTLSYSLKNIIFRNQTSFTSDKGVNSPYGSFDVYTQMNPYWRMKNDEGEWYKSYTLPNGTLVGNPMRDATLNTIDSKDYTEITNNFSIDWTVFDGLRVNAKFGISNNVNHEDNFKPASHSSFNKGNMKEFSDADYFRKGSYKYKTGENLNYDGNITINYSKIFAEKHNIYFGLDYSISQKDSYNYNFEVNGFSNDRFDFLTNANAYSSNKPAGGESVSRRIGFTGNLNYTYNNRYFADFSYRMDGSSQFGSNSKFAPFWSAGLGWNLHREAFIMKSEFINNLRIRASYGETGSQQFSPYQALATYEYFTGDRYMFWNGAALKGLGNPDLKWQVTKQNNMGVELGLWNNRLSASFDIYSKKTTNLLSQMNLESVNGFLSYTDNVGAVKNSGYEGMISGYIIRNLASNIVWSVTAKIAYNKNEVAELSDAIKKQNEEYLSKGSSNSNLLFEGDPMNAIYVVPSRGIDPSTGREVFINRFGDPTYTWDFRDRVFMGIEEPKWRGNISTMFTFKDLTVNMSFGYRFGGQQYNQTIIDKVENANMNYNVDRRVYEERWQKPGDIVYFKGLKETGASKYSSRFVQDENTFELQSLSISYKLSNKWLEESFKLNSLNIGCNMSDVFYFSSIKRERGTAYPFARKISLTLSLLF